MECTVSQGYSDYNRQPKSHLASRLIFINLMYSVSHRMILMTRKAYKVDLYLFYRTGPSVEAKHLVGQIDAFV